MQRTWWPEAGSIIVTGPYCAWSFSPFWIIYGRLKNFIVEHDPDVLAITETWLTEDITDAEFTPEGFTCFRKDRNLSHYKPNTYVNPARGGVLFLIKSHLNAIRREDLETDCELLWVDLKPLPNMTWLAGVCYRPEVDQELILQRIEESFSRIDNENCFVLGDFNFRNIEWQTKTGKSKLDKTFITITEDNLLSQMVDEPTRGDNILDLAFVTDMSACTSCQVGEGLGRSDHQSIWVNLKCLVPLINSSPRKIYLYSKGDYEGMNKEPAEIDFNNIYDNKSVDHCWDSFKASYEELIEKYVPHKYVKPGARHKPPWVRYRSVNKAKVKARKSFIRARTSGLSADKILHRNNKAAVSESLSKAKAHFEDKLVDRISEEPKQFWNYTRHFTRSSSTIDSLEENSETITDDSTKSEILNEYFTSVLVDEPPLDATFPKLKSKAQFTLSDIHFSEEVLAKKLLKLKPDRASGPDGVSVNTLRSCPNFSRPLSIIFNISMKTSSLPQDWRDANINPLQKGSRSSKKNYRPVSLTSQVVKLMERVIQDHLQSLLSKNRTIHCDQHGFQERCSCITQLLECLNHWTDNFDNKSQTDAIYLDFAKAFGTVPHKRLILKLQ